MRPISISLLALLACTAPLAAQEQGDSTARQRQIIIESPTQKLAADTLIVRSLPGRRGWLGFRYAPGSLVAVAEVMPNSPAARGGLAAGDTIVRVNGSAARAALAELRLAPGDTVRLRVRRAGRTRALRLVAAPRPPERITITTPGRRFTFDVDSIQREVGQQLRRIPWDSVQTRMDSAFAMMRRIQVDSIGRELRVFRDDSTFGPSAVWMDLAGRRALAGAEWSELNPELGRYFGTDRGVLVLRVAPGTPAARAGLQPGDVVQRAGGREVSTVAELRRAIARADGKLRLDVLRERTRREIRLRWEGERSRVR